MENIKKWSTPIVSSLDICETKFRILTQTCIKCGYQNVIKVNGYSEELGQVVNSMVKQFCPICGASREFLAESWSANPDDNCYS